ncbi:FAD/NAD(P)-binding domain-containing protein [Stipitochalara longipes BDJ]|nr:FAD/NAD(P)-binding domain-containing protein [Stipitochalara longipes BDJ]
MSTPYKILNQYHSKPTKLRVACIGAGASGLCVIYKMMLVPGSWELTVFEKNPGVGGTWLKNTCPGVACDTPASLYTHYYAYGSEIGQYFEDFADKNECRKFIQFYTKLVEARWDEEKGIWNTLVDDQITKERGKDWCHVLGSHVFAGPKMHSAKWDASVDYKNKTLVPAVQKDVKHMTAFMRSPTWIAPPWGTSVLEEDIRKGKKIEKGKSQHMFTDEEKQRFKDDPDAYLAIRKRLEAEFNSIIQGWIRGTPSAKTIRESITEEMESRIGTGPESEMLREMLIPKWAPGCRRISPGDGYLEALQQPNVKPVFGAIKRITPEGPSFKPAFPLYNGKGKSLDEDWGQHVNLYLGLTAPRFPNYFTIAGPGSTWAAGSLLPSIEAGVEYVVKVMKKIQQEQIKSVEVRQDALDDLFEHFDEFHKETVYQDNCRSWHKDGKIKNRVYLWPGGTIHHVKTLKEPRYEDYSIRYRYGNCFAFLGNGEVKANMTGDVQGLSTYMRTSDHDWDIE